MPDPRQLGNERTTNSALEADIVHKLNYWSEDLRSRGLLVEGVVMYEAATEIMMLRAETGGVARGKARRGPMGDISRRG